MRILATITLALLAAGCGNPLPDAAEPTERSDVDALVQAWEAEPSLPSADTRRCQQDLGAVRTAVVGDAEFTEHCVACPPGNCPGREPTAACPYGCAAACMVRECWGGWLYSAAEIGCDHREPVVVVHESRADTRVVLHELAHLVAECALGHSDRGHESEAVWGCGGVLDRAGGQPVRCGGEARLLAPARHNLADRRRIDAEYVGDRAPLLACRPSAPDLRDVVLGQLGVGVGLAAQLVHGNQSFPWARPRGVTAPPGSSDRASSVAHHTRPNRHRERDRRWES